MARSRKVTETFNSEGDQNVVGRLLFPSHSCFQFDQDRLWAICMSGAAGRRSIGKSSETFGFMLLLLSRHLR